MKLIQKILSHGLLLAFVAAAFFAYTNRSTWFPQWFGYTAKTKQPHTVVKPGVAEPEVADTTRIQPSAPAVQVQRAPKAAPLPKPAKSDVVERTAEPVVIDTGDSTPIETIEAETDVEPESAQTQDVTVTPRPADTAAALALAQSGSVENTETVVVPAVPEDNSDQTHVVPKQAASQTDIQLDKRLEEARQRYWQRDLPGAATAYQALGEDYPDNPDVWGEMGNVYFSMRQREPAANAYYRCIELLVEQGAPERAWQLLGVLYRLDASKAQALEARMQQAGG